MVELHEARLDCGVPVHGARGPVADVSTSLGTLRGVFVVYHKPHSRLHVEQAQDRKLNTSMADSAGKSKNHAALSSRFHR